PDRVVNLGYRLGNARIECSQMKLAAALERPAFADVVDDQSAHRVCRVRDEAVPIRERCRAARHVEVALAQQRRGAERYAGAASPQLPPRETMQLVIKGREQRLRGPGIAPIGACN